MDIKEKDYSVKTTIVSTHDETKTYEIRKEFDGLEGRKKMMIIESYPMVRADSIHCLDSSWMHLQNHLPELNLGMIRLVNLFATVWSRKPSTSELVYEEENLSYIEEVIRTKGYGDGVIVAWGTGLATNHVAVKMKLKILAMLKDNKVKNVYRITAEGMNADGGDCVHPLFLGLRFGKSKWSIEKYHLDGAIQYLEEQVRQHDGKKKEKKKAKKRQESSDGKKEEKTGEIEVEMLEEIPKSK